MQQDFWSVQLKDIISLLILAVTCFAVYYGPIKAVQVARTEEERASRRRQKAQIFSSLMKTRRFQLDPEHVSSLNLVQVYFNDEPKVLAAFKEYIRLLSRRSAEGGNNDDLFRERDNAFIELVYEIATSLGHGHDRKEIQELAYSPEGWANDEAALRRLRHLMIETLENRRGIIIMPHAVAAPNNPFPPPPEEKRIES